MPVSVGSKKRSGENDLGVVGKAKRSRIVRPEDQKNKAQSSVQCNLSNCTREQVRDYFTNSYDLDEYIFSAIKDECDINKCPDRLRLPLIFYLAHTASVYVNKLMLAGLIKDRVNKHFEVMFETGVDEMSWDDTENYRMGGAYQWPSVKSVMSYRQQVRKVILDFINSATLDLPVKIDTPLWSLFMGMEHERIHLETSSVLLRQLPVSMLKRPDNWKYGPHSTGVPVGPNDLVRVPRGKVVMGKPRDFPSFGWDNEYGQVEMEVPEFEATKYLTTNKEFLEFVQDNGYQRRELWTDEGWKWVEFRQAKHPIFWVCNEGCKSGCGADLATHSHCCHDNRNPHEQNGTSEKYLYRAIYDVLPMPWDWPVDVNYHEANAFCKWKGPGYRLPTEAEHHRMRGDPLPSTDTECDPGFNPDYPANINFKYGSSTPVNMFPPTSTGFYDVYGNVWEWLEDHFNGLPGFKTTYFYDDFSTPCFDGRHTMISGGSWISTGAEASRFARFAFRRHFFQHAGFRMARSQAPVPARWCQAEVFVLGAGVSDNPATIEGTEECFHASTNSQFQFETLPELHAQLQAEFGEMNENGKPLVEYVENIASKYSDEDARQSAAVLGCGAGLTSHLLTKTFDQIIGVDFSGRFIDSAMSLQSGKTVSYGEGEVAATLHSLEGIKPDRVTFKQMTWVPNEMEGFNVVVVEFLDRLSEPRGWLIKLWECVQPRGLVVVAASDKWDHNTVGTYIGKWFSFLEETRIGNRLVTVWQLK